MDIQLLRLILVGSILACKLDGACLRVSLMHRPLQIVQVAAHDHGLLPRLDGHLRRKHLVASQLSSHGFIAYSIHNCFRTFIFVSFKMQTLSLVSHPLGAGYLNLLLRTQLVMHDHWVSLVAAVMDAIFSS